MSDFREKLREVLREENICEGEPMRSHTTFRIGGPADWFVEPENEEELAGVIALCREERMPFCILGNGSNLLVGDRGFRGTVISMARGFSAVEVSGKRVRAQAGAMLSRVAREACAGSLTGLEFAAGIPGSLGGAVVMNAGAYGGEMRDVIETVTVMGASGEILKKTPEELAMGYRTSNIPGEGYTVLEADLLLEEGSREAIRARMEELAAMRRCKQPLEYPSAGSTFKRPEGYFAGKLIDDAGLRGFCMGGAQVSEKHCGFVVNRGEATAADVIGLCRHVRETVREKFGVELEMEVKTIGEF